MKPETTVGGRMIDDMDEALNLLAERPGPRRANILLISESKDRGSKEKLSDLIPKLQQTGATVYSLTYSAYLTPFTTKSGGLEMAFTELARLAKQNTVEALTDVTGGRRFRFETKSKLENDLIGLGNEIHSRYLLSFTPELASVPRFHHLQVEIKDHLEALVRARPGYWASE